MMKKKPGFRSTLLKVPLIVAKRSKPKFCMIRNPDKSNHWFCSTHGEATHATLRACFQESWNARRTTISCFEKSWCNQCWVERVSFLNFDLPSRLLDQWFNSNLKPCHQSRKWVGRQKRNSQWNDFVGKRGLGKTRQYPIVEALWWNWSTVGKRKSFFSYRWLDVSQNAKVLIFSHSKKWRKSAKKTTGWRILKNSEIGSWLKTGKKFLNFKKKSKKEWIKYNLYYINLGLTQMTLQHPNNSISICLHWLG